MAAWSLHGVGLQPHQRADQRQAVGDAVIDLGEQHLGAVARPREIGGAPLHALLEARVERAHLVARLRDFARVARSRDHHAADHQNDDDAADDRHPAQHRGIGALLADARGQPLVGGPDDAGEKDVGLVHQRLAAIGAEQRQALGVPAVALQRDGLVHLAELFVDDCGQPRSIGADCESPLMRLVRASSWRSDCACAVS